MCPQQTMLHKLMAKKQRAVNSTTRHASALDYNFHLEMYANKAKQIESKTWTHAKNRKRSQNIHLFVCISKEYRGGRKKNILV